MRLGLVAILLTLSLLPTAAAQAPDPGDAILLACGTIGGIEAQARDLLPVCPRAEPAAPAPAGDAPAAAPAPADAAAPEAAAALADRIAAEAAAAAGDPTSAPDRIVGLVTLVVQFVRDLLDIPVEFGGAVDAALTDVQVAVKSVNAAAGDALSTAATAVADAGAAFAAKVGALFDRDAPATLPQPAQLPRGPPVRTPTIALPLAEIRGALDG